MGGATTLFTKFPNSKNRLSFFSMSQIIEIAASFFCCGGGTLQADVKALKRKEAAFLTCYFFEFSK